MKKRIISMILSIIMVIGILPANVFATNDVFAFFDRKEPAFVETIQPQDIVPEGFIGVYTIEDLDQIRELPSENYILMCDLDLSGISWDPIGDIKIPFTGIFDGNGYAIHNLTIDKEGFYASYVGLFGYCEGTIKNLSVPTGSIITDEYDTYVGSIAGYAKTMENCSSGCEINASCRYGGGIAGAVGEITKCYFFGELNFECSEYFGTSTSVKMEYALFGGICGKADKISKCLNSGTISGYVSPNLADVRAFSGGVVGYSRYIDDCGNTGVINFAGDGTDTHLGAGGISGGSLMWSDSIKNCYNTGAVSVESTQYSGAVGGIVGGGHITGSYSIESCYNLGTLTNKSKYRNNWYIGAMAGLGTVVLKSCYKDQYAFAGSGNVSSDITILSNAKTLDAVSFKDKDSFVGFDFENTWELEAYMTSPQLRVFHSILYPSDDVVETVTYTHFGQYNGSTQKYVTDPTTGLSKYLMGTVTIDGTTYDVADTCTQESLYLPADYLGNYYYIAYNLNESNEVSEAKIMPGIVCTLEGYDPATKVVDTDYEPIIPVGEDRTLPSGNYYVSDITASSFPSDQIGSWVGDQVRVYCVGEQIFKVIHIVEGTGVITNYDEDNSKVYIDDICYNLYPDAELINAIKQSLLYSKAYVLYDNILVSLSSDNKYLSVEINNTGKSYFVGDEIRFFIYDCTETEDDYLHWTKPEGLVIQISDNETISLKKHIEYEDFTECVFVADKPGVVTINISDDITSTPIAVTLHIAEDKYQSLRANNVPTYEYDIVIDKDFYNTYVNGMYVTDFTYKYNSYGTYTFDFSVYNETYAPGVVEVYNEKGELIDIKTIKKFSDPSSLKSVVYGGKDMIVDLWNGDSFSFRGVSASKKTEISVELPVDGYVVVTNSCVLSPTCLYVNLIDYFLTGTSLIDSTVKFDTDTFDYISRETIWAVLSSEYGTSTLATFHEDFFKEYATTIAQGSVSTIFGIATDNINMLLDSIDVNFEDILKDAGIGYAFSTVQDLLQKGGGPAGAALSAIFYVQKMLNFTMQTMHLANNSTNEIAWAVFTPYIDDRGMTEITSKDGITVKSEDEFPTDTILQVYKIVDYSNATSGLDIDENDKYTLYDISLVCRGQEVQPDQPVTVYVPIPEGFLQSSIFVYKQDQYGNWEFVEIMIYNGMIVFEVAHFCLFAIIDDSKDNLNSEYIVTFNPNGGTVSQNSLTTNSDGKLASFPIATRNGYNFDGWYTDPVNGTKITTSTVFTSNATVYAHWTKETTSDFDDDYWYWVLMQLYNQEFDITASATEGGTISPAGNSKVKYDKNITYTITPDEGYAIADVLVNGESVGAVSEYTFKRVKADHTIHAIFVKTAWENPYTDVSSEAWYYKDIEFVTENGLMIGTGDNKFSPNAIVNRAMLVTVLWRLEGSPVVDSPVDFYDVPADEWYTAAVNWAAANGIVNGYGNGEFGAMDDLTHEQIMAILNRYAVYKQWSKNVSGNADDSYTNSEWAENNVLWADLNGMFDGIGSDISNLTEGADRAELAAYLRRFCERFMAE